MKKCLSSGYWHHLFRWPTGFVTSGLLYNFYSNKKKYFFQFSLNMSETVRLPVPHTLIYILSAWIERASINLSFLFVLLFGFLFANLDVYVCAREQLRFLSLSALSKLLDFSNSLCSRKQNWKPKFSFYVFFLLRINLRHSNHLRLITEWNHELVQFWA